MINMKIKNRILIAGLMAIAVTGASTLAYFTSNVTIASNGDSSGVLTLDITNGTVKITGKIGDGQDGTPNWSYDVARYSTKDYNKLGTSGNTVAGITTTADKATDITNYENKHRSPDIEGLDSTDKLPEGSPDGIPDKKEDVSGVKRWKIGTAVTGEISKARPGDAFVLGKAEPGGSGTNAGLTIENTSTLTTKIDMGLSGDDTTAQQNILDKLKKSGFKLYVGSSIKDMEEISEVKDSGKKGEENYKKGLNTKLKDILGDSIAPATSKKIYIRLELPLETGDDFQNGKTGYLAINNFDISKLFTIKATQENNPGWTTGGTN